MPWLVWLLAIFILSLLPGDQLPELKFDWFEIDTAVHIVMYFVLVFLMLVGFFKIKNELFPSQVLYIIVIGLIIGLAIEFIQGHFISNRFFSWKDVMANSIGGCAGYFIFSICKKKILTW